MKLRPLLSLARRSPAKAAPFSTLIHSVPLAYRYPRGRTVYPPASRLGVFYFLLSSNPVPSALSPFSTFAFRLSTLFAS